MYNNEQFKLITRRFIALPLVGAAIAAGLFLVVYGALSGQIELATMGGAALFTELGANSTVCLAMIPPLGHCAGYCSATACPTVISDNYADSYLFPDIDLAGSNIQVLHPEVGHWHCGCPKGAS